MAASNSGPDELSVHTQWHNPFYKQRKELM